MQQITTGPVKTGRRQQLQMKNQEKQARPLLVSLSSGCRRMVASTQTNGAAGQIHPDPHWKKKIQNVFNFTSPTDVKYM